MSTASGAEILQATAPPAEGATDASQPPAGAVETPAETPAAADDLQALAAKTAEQAHGKMEVSEYKQQIRALEERLAAVETTPYSRARELMEQGKIDDAMSEVFGTNFEGVTQKMLGIEPESASEPVTKMDLEEMRRTVAEEIRAEQQKAEQEKAEKAFSEFKESLPSYIEGVAEQMPALAVYDPTGEAVLNVMAAHLQEHNTPISLEDAAKRVEQFFSERFEKMQERLGGGKREPAPARTPAPPSLSNDLSTVSRSEQKSDFHDPSVDMNDAKRKAIAAYQRRAQQK